MNKGTVSVTAHKHHASVTSFQPHRLTEGPRPLSLCQHLGGQPLWWPLPQPCPHLGSCQVQTHPVRSPEAPSSHRACLLTRALQNGKESKRPRASTLHGPGWGIPEPLRRTFWVHTHILLCPCTERSSQPAVTLYAEQAGPPPSDSGQTPVS